MSNLDPWFETPAVKGESVERGNADGEFDLPTNYAARIIPFSGRLLCSGPSQVRAAANRLAGLLHGGLVTMQVTDAGGTTWAKVKRNGPTVPVKVNDRMLRFQFDLKAPDPRKFGAVQSVPAGVGSATPIQNRGNYPATPVIVVAGPVSAGGYTVTGPGGEVFTVTTSPTAGITHLINMHDGLLRVNGSISAGAGLVSRADTFTIPPGGKLNVTLSKGGRVELYDTYI
ncbi:hypothetical protein ACFFON_15485 [Arthrobacter citreus]|uniref:hypothetical protein n=1 Tax=Arthrobacter TaxID=1663 RepID=UPI0014788B7B|nr:hypothetical protein [Arthrobacter gandavensis]